MSGAWYVGRASWRRSFRALLFLGLVAGLVGGVVLGAIAGAHRFDSLADVLKRAAMENQLYVETMFNLGTNVGSLAASTWSGAVTAADLILPPPAEGSAEVAARVAAARDIQLARYAAVGLAKVRTNAEAPASALEEIAKPDAQGQKLLRDAAETMRLSARGYHRVLRVARTLADLDGTEKIGRLHLAEALSYRALAEDVRQMA